jgi:hypothetical protein
MPRYLIEVPHSSDTLACTRVVHVFLTSGSHFLSNADWGCKDGVHKAWFIVDVDNKEEARAIVPAAFRSEAKIIGLTKFQLDQIESYLERHKNQP